MPYSSGGTDEIAGACLPDTLYQEIGHGAIVADKKGGCGFRPDNKVRFVLAGP